MAHEEIHFNIGSGGYKLCICSCSKCFDWKIPCNCGECDCKTDPKMSSHPDFTVNAKDKKS